jgi:hypothetical protein
MKTQSLTLCAVLAGALLLNQHVSAQSLNTPPASPAEIEALYTSSIESRTQEILKLLGLTDTAKLNAVHDIIIWQYRTMRARDALIDAQLQATGKTVNYSNRAERLEAESKPLHDYFIARLSKVLTSDQIVKVKDKMTYNKVKVTYDAYVAIVPGLTDADKTKIMDLLKAAREKAMDGGSATEKSAIFQVYKDQINEYLNAHGHDVSAAYKAWAARQPANTNIDATFSSGTANQ